VRRNGPAASGVACPFSASRFSRPFARGHRRLRRVRLSARRPDQIEKTRAPFWQCPLAPLSRARSAPDFSFRRYAPVEGQQSAAPAAIAVSGVPARHTSPVMAVSSLGCGPVPRGRPVFECRARFAGAGAGVRKPPVFGLPEIARQPHDHPPSGRELARPRLSSGAAGGGLFARLPRIFSLRFPSDASRVAAFAGPARRAILGPPHPAARESARFSPRRVLQRFGPARRRFVQLPPWPCLWASP